jgi:diguanylate cyclase (GGDEF)-like protein
MQHNVRPEDIIGRLAGDEFIAILPGVELETDGLKVVKRILRAVEKPIEIGKGVCASVTASIGLSRFPIDGTTSDALISRSDLAMYRAKENGGNAYDLAPADHIRNSRGNR